MKKMILAVGFLTAFSSAAFAADHCSMGLAKKFADGVIAVEMKDTKMDGQVIFQRSNSHEYTMEWLNEQLRMNADPSGQYLKIKNEITDRPDLHVYYLQYQLKRDNGNHLAFYYKIYLKNYDYGCTLQNLSAD